MAPSIVDIYLVMRAIAWARTTVGCVFISKPTNKLNTFDSKITILPVYITCILLGFFDQPAF